MIPSLELVLRAFHLGLLHGASLLVPGKARAEWLQDWQSELWYVQRECLSMGSAPSRGERNVTAFCMGAYQDAFCLRRQSCQERSPFAQMRGSASLCILSLTALSGLSYCVALLSPGVCAERHLSRYRVCSGYTLHQDTRYQSDTWSTIPPAEQFRKFFGNRQGYLDGVAFYRIGQETISAPSRIDDGWAVAHASSNLFALLELPVRFVMPDGGDNRDLPSLLHCLELNGKRAIPHRLKTGRHEIFAGGKKVSMSGAEHTLVLNDEHVHAAANDTLDKLGIAKNSREEKLKARDVKLKQDAENAQMALLYREHILGEKPQDGFIPLDTFIAAAPRVDPQSAKEEPVMGE